MTYPTFIEIDGKRFVWRELVRRRREQLQACARAVQPALFELKDDCRPVVERSAAGRYAAPSLFTLLDADGRAMTIGDGPYPDADRSAGNGLSQKCIVRYRTQA